jgi:cell division septation protein DedD
MTRLSLFVLLAALISGCNLIYKQNVQQGNAQDQEDLDQVELGMTKRQVAFLLGTPAIHDPFHKDRWDYISMFSRRGGDPVRRLVTLHFEDDILVSTDGIGDSRGGDIKALAETRSAVEQAADQSTLRDTLLVSDDAVINWTLQLGAYGTHAEADKLARAVRDAGYQANLEVHVVPGLGTRHQVRSGQFNTFNEAQAALRRIEKDLDIVGITVPVETAIDTGEQTDATLRTQPEPSTEREIEFIQEVPEQAQSVAEEQVPAIEAAAQAVDEGTPPTTEPAVTQPPAAAEPTAEATTQQAPVSPAPPAQPSSDTPRYFVQVGSFTRPENAETLVNRLQAAGFDVSTTEAETPTGTVTKVQVGPAASRDAADELLNELKAQYDLDGFVVTGR